MTWSYAYTPSIWPSVFTVLLMLALVIFVFRRRYAPGVLPFIIGCLFGAAWAAGSVMEYAAADLPTKIIWIRFQAIWQLPAATAVTCFVLEYTWPGRWLTRRSLVLFSAAPILLMGLIWTDGFHHLMWRTFNSSDGIVVPELGPMSWAGIIYSFGLVLLNLVVLGWLFLRSPQHRWPVGVIAAGQIGFRIIFLLEKADFIYSELPLPVLGLAFIDLMYAVALIGFQFFDPIPLARQTTIEQLHDGMLVLDLHGRVASLNPAAERILGLSEKQAKGQPVKGFLPAYPDGPLAATGDLEIEIEHQAGQEIGYYILSISSLKDWRGMEAGRLLLLHDVTSRKQAEAALNKSREIQRLIFEKSFDGISIYEERQDPDERILVDCNERYCQMAGRSKEELLAIQDPRGFQRVENPAEDSDRASVLAGQVFSGVFSWIRPDGKANVIEYNAAPIRVGDRFFTIGVDRDVTESRQIQAQILEQQQALSILHERERLACELHDELAQGLALINLQAQLVSGLLAAGQEEQAQAQLQVLAKAAREAQVDVRGEISKLLFNIAREMDFYGALRHFMETFQQTYGTVTELTVPAAQPAITFTPTVEVQLLRIVQEAFSNIRKHAGATHVRVALKRENGCVELSIEENGVGFDPLKVPAGGRSFGLGIMSARAAKINGRVQVDSAPGKGTRVTVVIPDSGDPSLSTVHEEKEAR